LPHALQVAVISPALFSIIHFRGLLLKALVERGHAVTTYAPHDCEPEPLTRLGVEFRAIPLDPAGTNPVGETATVRALLGFWRKTRPDVVLNCAVKPAIYGSLAARWRGIPRIFSLITGRGAAFGESGRLVELATRLLCRHSLSCNRVVFFQNPDDRDLFRRLKLLRAPSVLVNGSGVDLEFYRPAPLPNHVSFLLIGRLRSEKGVREYVEAARIVRATHPSVTFRLAGGLDGRRPSISEREVQGWVDEGVVEYLGDLPDVRPALARSSVFVLPSYREGQPRSVMEAMAMGRPIITTDAPGCRETVEAGRNGHLVPVRDVGALAASMQWFLDHPQCVARMGQEGRRIAERKYDIHAVNRVLMETMGLA